MKTVILEFTEYSDQNLNKVLDALKPFNFIKVKNTIKQAETEDKSPVSLHKMQELYPDEWILIAEPKMKDGVLISGIVLFHHADKRQLAQANANGILTKQYGHATHIFTGNLPKMNRIGIFKQTANEKV